MSVEEAEEWVVMPPPEYLDEDLDEGVDDKGGMVDTTGMIAITLNDEEHLQWLELKEKLKIPQDKKAFLHILNTYSYDGDSL